MSSKQGIILFTKVPKPGLVKTRLVHPQFPEDFQVDLTTAMIQDSIIVLNEVLKKTSFLPIISYFPGNDSALRLMETRVINDLRLNCRSLIDEAIFVPQIGDTLGERFSNALKSTIDNLEVKSIVIIGSDTPHLSPYYLLQGMEFLASNPKGIVIGPSQNGGFYLLGMNPPCPDHIDQIFQKTSIHNELGAALELYSNQEIHILPTVIDIDTFSDLRSVFSEVYARSFTNKITSNKRVAMHTWYVLKTLDESIWGS